VQSLIKDFDADTGIKNELGHTAIWTAENNEKEEIVAWLEKEMGIEGEEGMADGEEDANEHGDQINETIRKLEKVQVEGQENGRPVRDEDFVSKKGKGKE